MKFKTQDFSITLVDDLLKYGRVKVTGLGIFSLKRMKGRNGYSIGSNSMVEYPEYVKVVFSPTLLFKEKVQVWNKKKI